MEGRRHSKSEHGAAAIEFALVLPVLLLLLFGIIEFGLLLFNKAVLTNAAREGARFGIVSATPRKTDDEIEDTVTSYTAHNLVTFGSPNVPAVTPTHVDGQEFGDPLTVTVTYQYQFLVMNSLVPVLDENIELKAESTMNYE